MSLANCMVSLVGDFSDDVAVKASTQPYKLVFIKIPLNDRHPRHAAARTFL